MLIMTEDRTAFADQKSTCVLTTSDARVVALGEWNVLEEIKSAVRSYCLLLRFCIAQTQKCCKIAVLFVLGKWLGLVRAID